MDGHRTDVRVGPAPAARASGPLRDEAHEMQRGRRRPVADVLARPREAPLERPLGAVGARRGGRPARPASSGVPPPGPAMPVTDTATSAPVRAARALRHRPRALRLRRRRTRRAARPGRRAAACLSSLRRRRARRRARRRRPARPPGATRPGRRCSSRRWRASAPGRAARRARAPRAWRAPRRRPRGRTARAGRPRGARRPARPRPAPRITTSISERDAQMVVSVPPRVAAEVLERVGDRRLRARRRCAAPSAAAPRPGAAPRAGSRSPSCHIRESSTGGPGSTTIRWSPTGMITPGAVPTGGSISAPAGTRRLLAVAAHEAGRIDAAGAGELGHDRVDGARASARRAPAERPATCATHATVRSSCVGPRPPDVSTRSTPLASSCSSAATIDSASSSTATTRSSRTPCSRRAARARNDELVSTVRPSRISEPVTRTAARARVT